MNPENDLNCPICGSSEFEDFRGRHNARCVGCSSLERTRYFWLFLQQTNRLQEGLRVLHVAPEKCICVRLAQIIGPNYKPCDLVPKRYANEGIEIGKLDLCNDLENFEEATFDMVMHLHVLEHLPCDLQIVFEHTMRILRPGGSFIFALPIAPGITIENIWPDVLPEERQKTFGQDDHLRLVGDADFPRFLARVLKPFAEPPYVVDPLDIADQRDLQRACIPVRQNRLHGNTLFCVKKLPARPNG